MAAFEVNIVRVELEPHPNADAIELAVVGEYRSIVKKGNYATGDFAAYIPAGALVPEYLLKRTGFWDDTKGKGMLAGSQGDRVKEIKLRGVLSEGIVIPCDRHAHDDFSFWSICGPDTDDWRIVEVGDDVKDILGVTKWEPPIPVHMAGEVDNRTGWTINYDIENLKKFPDVFVPGENVVITEKIHGCVSPDTMITVTDDLILPISVVIADDRITQLKSFDIKTGTYVMKDITGKMRRENKENKKWMLITLDNGNVLKITEDHPIYSRDRMAYIEARDIKTGEDIESYGF